MPILMPTPEYEVDIDFDESSREWRKNKHVLKNGAGFLYKKCKKNCVYVYETGIKCRKKQKIGADEHYCEIHFCGVEKYKDIV